MCHETDIGIKVSEVPWVLLNTSAQSESKTTVSPLFPQTTLFLGSAVAEGPQLEFKHTSASGVLLLDSSGLAMEKAENNFLFLHYCVFFSAQCNPENCQSLSWLNFQLPKWSDLFPIPFIMYEVLVMWEKIQTTYSFDLSHFRTEKSKKYFFSWDDHVDTVVKVRSMFWKKYLV